MTSSLSSSRQMKKLPHDLRCLVFLRSAVFATKGEATVDSGGV